MVSQSNGVAKIFILGPANSGKTSIARFLATANRSFALNTTPSTSIERFKTLVLALQVNIFVTPGQKRFKARNFEYLCGIIDPKSVILYVVDASERTKMDDYLKEFMEIMNKVEAVFQKTFPREKIEVAFLAHKQDLTGSLSVKNIFSNGVMQKISKTFPHINLHLYDTSIFMPTSLLGVIADLVLSKIIPVNSIKGMLTYLRDYAEAEAVIIGDGMGLPIFFSGNSGLTSWSAAFAARIIESLEREKEIANSLKDEAYIRLLNSSRTIKIRLNLALEESEILTYIFQCKEHSISLTLINARNKANALDAYAMKAVEVLFSKIYLETIGHECTRVGD
ncbi:MAG: ADP-ribosylation factor-like protein [Crenarchaeota archaeon]|nr:ADP-ribosylation factor-like protein [Thermoproteota archaeon]